MEIEIFLSGHGMPEKNLLSVKWSSPYVIYEADPGDLKWSIMCLTDLNTGEMKPQVGIGVGEMEVAAGKGFENMVKVGRIGVELNLNRGHFLEVENQAVPEFGMRCVVAERVYPPHYQPPLLLRINTATDARSGDYEVTFVFTYGDKDWWQQDYKGVKFHVTSWLERNRWLPITGVIIAFLSLVVTAIAVAA